VNAAALLAALDLPAGARVGQVVLYDGESSAGFGNRLLAVPIRGLWETT